MPSPLHSTLYGQFRAAHIQARKDANLAQEALSAKLSRPQSCVSKYERGERRLDVIEFLVIAEAVGFDPVRLIRSLQGK
jgi:ribosome-binding protein aMBF1 (putative translation factor)